MSRRNKVLLALVGLVLAAQLLRPAKTNPPIDPQRELTAHTQMPPQVSDLLNRGCRDCHSYRTSWPWYSNVAPFSWIIADDVNQGRRHVNFSDWAQYDPKRADHKLDQICDEVKDGGMPLTSYKWMHSAARLTDHERAEICLWVGAERERLAKADRMHQTP
jgi:heme-binding protein